MKKLYFLFAFTTMLASSSLAQVAISTNGSSPDNSAMLDVKSTSKGFLPPRMTAAEMNAIVTPVQGLLVYNTTVNSLFWFNGSIWKQFNEPYTEADPVFTAHPASGITSGYITNWNAAFANRITLATGTAPLNLSISSNQLSGSITASNASTNGYLSSANWNTFNNKQNALTFGNATSGDLTITGGNGAIIGSGMTLSVNKGSLTSSDMSITGGSGSVLGSGTSMIINKGSLIESGSSVLTITGGSNSVLGTGATIQVKQANTTQSGYLSNTDWNSFNNKVSSQWTANSLKLHYITGNVGIGTTNPQNKVDIAGNAVIGSSYSGINAAPANGLMVEGKVVVGTTSPTASASLEVTSTTTGVLLPRMTFAQRNAIVSPAEGLSVICTNCNADGTGCYSIYLGGQWLNLTGNCELPVAATEGSHVQTSGQIIWNWSAVPIATGYRWSATNNFATATDMGIATTKTETGLTQGISYTRYVWAYNACGNSSAVTLIAQALTCGSSFQIIHTIGTVAPVTKTVNYGTVTNIPGETSKCWITRNLGATQPPNAVSDNTEAAAGWYWQFNLKQGYMYDGTTRTPNTTWITTISQNSDWTANNDPCSLLLGSAWRLPTYAEWNNVDATGGWTNWNGPWSSTLQMHAAGLLYYSDGSLGSRGSYGYYLSSTQFDATYGWFLLFASSFSAMSYNSKSNGFSARCVRDL